MFIFIHYDAAHLRQLIVTSLLKGFNSALNVGCFYVIVTVCLSVYKNFSKTHFHKVGSGGTIDLRI